MALKLLNIIQRYPPALGGSEIYFQKLSEFLASKGHEVSVWTSNANNLESFWSTNHPLLPCTEESINSVKVRRFKLFHIPLQRLVLKIISKIPIRTLQCLTFSHNPIMPEMLKLASRCDETFDAVHAGCFPYAYPIYAAGPKNDDSISRSINQAAWEGWWKFLLSSFYVVLYSVYSFLNFSVPLVMLCL